MMASAQRLPHGSPARRERALRILDTAAELLRQHGYRRVSIDDVARAAGIGKGTVYLHWKTREALFWAVLQRESEELLRQLTTEVTADPTLALPGPLMRAIFLGAVRRPLVKALLLADAEVLGRLTEDESVAAAQKEMATNADYLAMLADQGLLRPGLTPKIAGHVLNSIMRGFFATESATQSGAEPPPVEDQADLVADVVERALQTDGSPSPEAVTGLATSVIALFTSITDLQRSQLERAY